MAGRPWISKDLSHYSQFMDFYNFNPAFLPYFQLLTAVARTDLQDHPPMTRGKSPILRGPDQSCSSHINFAGYISFSAGPKRTHFFSSLIVTSRQVVWLLLEQFRLEFVPVFHCLQGRFAAQG